MKMRKRSSLEARSRSKGYKSLLMAREISALELGEGIKLLPSYFPTQIR
jgi:hypothetical protein